MLRDLGPRSLGDGGKGAFIASYQGSDFVSLSILSLFLQMPSKLGALSQAMLYSEKDAQGGVLGVCREMVQLGLQSLQRTLHNTEVCRALSFVLKLCTGVDIGGDHGVVENMFTHSLN